MLKFEKMIKYNFLTVTTYPVIFKMKYPMTFRETFFN